MEMYLTPLELKAHLDGGWDATLLHLLPDEHYQGVHLPTALNACSYETRFLEVVNELVAERTAPILIYADGAMPYAVEAALLQLRQAGYDNIYILSGGLAAWQLAGYPVEGSGQLDEPLPETYDGDFTVNAEDSIIYWVGRNLFNHHEGALKLAGGHARISGGKLTGADFTIDMNSITCSDLEDAEINAMLIRHLKHTDFFAVEQFPTACVFLREALEIPGATPGVPNYEFRGMLQLRGISQEIAFPATVAPQSLNRLTAQAQFAFDRTRWNVLYGSSRFYNFLGKHVVNDHIHLHLKIHLDRNSDS